MGERHTTVIYGYNGAGEVMPTIYSFGSSAQNNYNFQVNPTWVQGLPKVHGKYVCPTTETYDSSVSLRKSGCTDKEFMQKLIENV